MTWGWRIFLSISAVFAALAVSPVRSAVQICGVRCVQEAVCCLVSLLPHGNGIYVSTHDTIAPTHARTSNSLASAEINVSLSS